MAHEVMISSEVIQILFDDTEFIYQDWWARNNSYLKKKLFLICWITMMNWVKPDLRETRLFHWNNKL